MDLIRFCVSPNRIMVITIPNDQHLMVRVFKKERQEMMWPVSRTEDILSLDKGWSIGERAFEAIVRSIDGLNKTTRLVEFGSGASSVRLALAFPQCQIQSIEGNWEIFLNTVNLAEVYNVQDNLEISYRPIWFQSYGSGQILSYENHGFFNQRLVDCAIIDGPPYYSLRGREACMYQIYDQIRIGGLIILDDFRRQREKQIIKNWISVYPGSFTVKIIREDHHLAILHKTREIKPHWQALNKVKDIYVTNEKYFYLCHALRYMDHEFINFVQTTSGTCHLKDYFENLKEIYGITEKMVQNCLNSSHQFSNLNKKKEQHKKYKIISQILFDEQKAVYNN